MKKAVATSLFVIMFASQVGYYFIYAFKQYQIKEEIEKEMLANIPDASLEIIIAEEHGTRIKWEKRDKEFSLDGVMYDVARIKKSEGKTYLYCINDKKEKQLLDDIVKAVNKNQNNKQSRNTIKSVLPDLIGKIDAEALSTDAESHKYALISESPVSSFKKINVPPPKV